MSDIFVSYSRTDAPRAQQLVSALKHSGYSLWWDQDIAVGQDFSHVIQQNLMAAKCVIVLWSQAAINSNWVPDEAARARERNVLLPVKLDPLEAPMGYGRLQYADLSNWSGDFADPQFQKLLHAVRVLGAVPTGQPGPSETATTIPVGWPDDMPHLAKGIPLARTLHGYSGYWRVRSEFLRWRDWDLRGTEKVTFNGRAVLYLEQDGRKGWGVQIGVLEAELGDYSETRWIGNKITDAKATEHGILTLRFENDHRCLDWDCDKGKPPELPARFGKDHLLKVKDWPAKLRPVSDGPKCLEGTHWYEHSRPPSQVAVETWEYLEL